MELSFQAALARGAVPSQGLKDWLARANHVMMTYSSTAQRQQYAAWAMEAAVRHARAGGPAATWNRLELLPPSNVVGGPAPPPPSYAAHAPPSYSVHAPPPPLPTAAVLPPREEERRRQLAAVCGERLAMLYASNPMASQAANTALHKELAIIASSVMRGERSFLSIGSEGLVAALLQPHALPPPPAHLVHRQLLPESRLQVPPPPIGPSGTLPNYGASAAKRQDTTAHGISQLNVGALQGRPRSPISGGAPDFDQQQVRRPQPPAPPPLFVHGGATHQGYRPHDTAPTKPVTAGEVSSRMAQFFPHHAIVTGRTQQYKVVVGTSDALERRHTREEPKEEDLRPRVMLPIALAHVLRKARAWAAGDMDAIMQAGSKAVMGLQPAWEAARWLSDQIKGMRQDAQVQHITDPFIVALYERHARLCLALGDGLEFNQCQSALQRFYHKGLRSERSASLPQSSIPAASAAAKQQVKSARGGKKVKNSIAVNESSGGTPRIAIEGTPIGELAADVSGSTGDDAVIEFTACRLIYLSLSGLFDTSARECQHLADAATVPLPDLIDHPAIKWALRAARALEARDGIDACDAFATLLRTDDVSVMLASSVAGLVAPALQRLRIQWLFSALHRGALKGTAPVSTVRAWLGFPMLDNFCSQYVIGNVLQGAGHPAPHDAWEQLWNAVKMMPGKDIPGFDASPGTVVDLASVGAKVLGYSAFLSSSSSGGV